MPFQIPRQSAHCAHELAQEIVTAIRSSANGQLDGVPIYLPITQLGSDVRLVIESSCSVAAATEIQCSTGQMHLPTMPFTDAIRGAIDALLKQVGQSDQAHQELLFDIITSLIVGMQNRA